MWDELNKLGKALGVPVASNDEIRRLADPGAAALARHMHAWPPAGTKAGSDDVQ